MLRYRVDAWPVALVLAATFLSFLPFLHELARWQLVGCWGALVYLRTFTAFIQHNHAHLRVFRPRAFNWFFDVLLAQHTGYPTALWELHHNLGHHRHFLDPDSDVASVKRPGSSEPMPRWLYCLRGNLAIHRDAIRVGLAERAGRNRWLLPKLLAEVLVQTAITVALLHTSIPRTVAFFLLPNLFVSWMVWWESYPHHLGLAPSNVYDGSATVEDPRYNLWTFNIGHHTAHHQKPTLHWSLLPEQTRRIRHQIPDHCLRHAGETAGARLFTLRTREAQSAGYRPGEGLFVAMLGDSTARDFAIDSNLRMLAKQWAKDRQNPFVNCDPQLSIESVFERLARRTALRAVQYARSGASVGPARTLMRRRLQFLANVKTFEEQVDELLVEPRFPDLTLIWIGHNNLDFVTELPRFSASGDLGKACWGIQTTFRKHFKAALNKLIARAEEEGRPAAIVVYGLVNPVATRLARDRARELKAGTAGLFPYLGTTEERFPPLRPEHGERLVRLSNALSSALEGMVREAALALPKASQLRIWFSRSTTEMKFTRPEYLHPKDAWHASEQGKALIAHALFEGLKPALPFLGVAE